VADLEEIKKSLGAEWKDKFPMNSSEELVRAAISKALWEAEEQATAEAYTRQPDSPNAAFDPTVWESRGFPDER
jgi:hypothetical protein